jgi:anti-anti-sigma regulatory factor
MTLHSQLELLLQRPAGVLVVDLHDVEQCDVTAVTVLRAAAAVAAASGGAMRLARPTGEVCALLRTTQVMRYIHTYGSLEAAVTADPIDLLDTPYTAPSRPPHRVPG